MRSLALAGALCLALGAYQISHRAFVRRASEVDSEVFLAANRGDVTRLALLLQNYRRLRTSLSLPLTAASSAGHVSAVRLLLQSGAPADGLDEQGVSALAWAASYGHSSIVQLLIAYGADVNVADAQYGYTPLMEAVRKGHLTTVRILLSSGARLDARTKGGSTALSLARMRRDTAMMELLSEKRE